MHISSTVIVIRHINKLKKKRNNSLNTKKALGRNPTSIPDLKKKNLTKSGAKENFLSPIKGIYSKSVVNYLL